MVEDFIHLEPHKYQLVHYLKIAERIKYEIVHILSTQPSLQIVFEWHDSTKQNAIFQVICYASQMRFLGIDYGTKRVGTALSDESGRMAFPHAVLPNDQELLTKLTDLITKEQVGEIVIGHSLDGKGQENAIHEAVKALITDLTLATGLPVRLEPEQYTTQEAIRFQGRNDKTDAAAATVILNSYLASNKNQSS